MRLPAEAIAKLSKPHLRVNVGDVWWLPAEHTRFPGGKDRFCLVVALEVPPGRKTPARAHYVVGSTRPGGPPEVVLDVAEANLPRRTYFRFWWSGDIDLSLLVRVGRFKGRLDHARDHEIGEAVRSSKRAGLKRLVG
jgi:hypothetical protein